MHININIMWIWTADIKVWMLLNITDSKVHGANMKPTWVLSASDGPMNFVIWDVIYAPIDLF